MDTFPGILIMSKQSKYLYSSCKNCAFFCENCEKSQHVEVFSTCEGSHSFNQVKQSYKQNEEICVDKTYALS